MPGRQVGLEICVTRLMSVVAVLATAGCGPPEKKLPPLPPALPTAGPVNSQPPPPSVERLFPWHTGDLWEMDAESGGQKFKFTLTATAEIEKDGKKTRFIEMKRDSESIQTEGYIVDEQGIHRTAFGPSGTGRIVPPMPILKAPVQDGSTWEWKGTMYPLEGSAVQVEATFKLTGPEDVKTPAGPYRAWRVEQKLTVMTAPSQKEETSNVLYFAPDVGVVQQVTVGPDGTTMGDLVRYAPSESARTRVK